MSGYLEVDYGNIRVEETEEKVRIGKVNATTIDKGKLGVLIDLLKIINQDGGD